MRYRIEHCTVYHYAGAAVATQQVLRLWPRTEAHQRVLLWSVRTPGSISANTDAYGNLTQMHTLNRMHQGLRIEARGEVEIDPLHGGRLEDSSGLPPGAFLADTRLTGPEGGVGEFARKWLKGRHATQLLDFALAVRATLAYEPGITQVRTTAAEALALGRGVCQDHAHLFIAGCRAVGVPARYVSGYYYRPQHADDTASHAWVDAWTDDGWISIDVTHECFASDSLVRLAVGRDYDSACPVRGVRVGGAREMMEVRLSINAEEMAGSNDRAGLREEEIA